MNGCFNRDSGMSSCALLQVRHQEGFLHSDEAQPAPIARNDLVAEKQARLAEIESLGRQCRAGDNAAWNLLFPAVWPALVTFVHRLYHSFDQSDAEDVAQASLEAAIRAIGSFNGRFPFRSWLFGIAAKQAALLHRARSTKKRGAHLTVPLTEATDSGDKIKSPAEISAANDRAILLHCAIDELDEIDRDLVHLHFFGELTFKEIAECRNMKAKTVGTRLARSKEKLLATLATFNLRHSNG